MENNKPAEQKSPMLLWAEKEIELACTKERECSVANDALSTDFEYGCGCYGSAFKAYKSLLSDGHSGMSICITKDILNRLIDHKPLTAIEDIPEVWRDVSMDSELEKGIHHYQCRRMSSLFKRTYPDGRVEYDDIDSYTCKTSTSNTYFSTGDPIIRKIVNELQPITFPYYPPSKPLVFIVTELLTDRANGDFDTKGILYVVKPGNTVINIGRYEKESDDGWEEITEGEYNERYRLHTERERREMEERISESSNKTDKEE